MTTGRSNKLVGQTGEYLVAAELSRRGFIATTFTGNVPHYDIIASDEAGRHVSVQVKTSRGATWQFGNMTHYCDITFDGKRQILGAGKDCPVRGLIMAFVRIQGDREDRFYILPWETLRDLLMEHHRAYLLRHDGIRPKKWDSLHAAISEEVLEPYRDGWDIVQEYLR